MSSCYYKGHGRHHSYYVTPRYPVSVWLASRQHGWSTLRGSTWTCIIGIIKLSLSLNVIRISIFKGNAKKYSTLIQRSEWPICWYIILVCIWRHLKSMSFSFIFIQGYYIQNITMKETTIRYGRMSLKRLGGSRGVLRALCPVEGERWTRGVWLRNTSS